MPHTPEPWYAHCEPHRFTIPERAVLRYFISANSDPNDEPVIAILLAPPEIDAEQQKANAELLVRAPRLLRALIKAKELIHTWHGIRDGKCPEIKGDPMWEIYERNAPEMREINELLTELNKCGVL